MPKLEKGIDMEFGRLLGTFTMPDAIGDTVEVSHVYGHPAYNDALGGINWGGALNGVFTRFKVDASGSYASRKGEYLLSGIKIPWGDSRIIDTDDTRFRGLQTGSYGSNGSWYPFVALVINTTLVYQTRILPVFGFRQSKEGPFINGADPNYVILRGDAAAISDSSNVYVYTFTQPGVAVRAKDDNGEHTKTFYLPFLGGRCSIISTEAALAFWTLQWQYGDESDVAWYSFAANTFGPSGLWDIYNGDTIISHYNNQFLVNGGTGEIGYKWAGYRRELEKRIVGSHVLETLPELLNQAAPNIFSNLGQFMALANTTWMQIASAQLLINSRVDSKIADADIPGQVQTEIAQTDFDSITEYLIEHESATREAGDARWGSGGTGVTEERVKQLINQYSVNI